MRLSREEKGHCFRKNMTDQKETKYGNMKGKYGSAKQSKKKMRQEGG